MREKERGNQELCRCYAKDQRKEVPTLHIRGQIYGRIIHITQIEHMNCGYKMTSLLRFFFVYVCALAKAPLGITS